MSPRKRKILDPKSKDFGTRFARHLRTLIDKRKMTPAAFVDELNGAKLAVSYSTIKKWLSGDRLPRAEDFETIGRVLHLKDYRDAMPPPA